MRKLTALIVAASLVVLLPSALGQTYSTTNTSALAACIQTADQKYKDTWDALCIQVGKPRRCVDFIGSPRDREFSQLRLEEMTLCGKLYR